ncbi:unnamed protein product [Thlaspi arvense]|uniref:Uncharacterized protein n=1 Tax=Thlaspi arvense TaxID=13288 RepID=A0AAU9RBL7_THLAR|nr:unnamed protein product [Thlaspi arvense]
MRVENGKTYSFWWDNWSPFGKLQDFIVSANGSRMGIPLEATLDDLYRDGLWRLPPARSDNQVLVQAHLTMLNLTTNEDYYEWEINNLTLHLYPTGLIYDILRNLSPQVTWWKIWNSIAQRCRFNSPRTWMLCLLAMQNLSGSKESYLKPSFFKPSVSLRNDATLVFYSPGLYPCDRRKSISTYRTCFSEIDFTMIESDEDALWQAEERENLEEVSTRGLIFVKRLWERPEKEIAVVSHGIFLQQTLRALHVNLISILFI